MENQLKLIDFEDNGGYELRTKTGKPLDEVISALQKAIRRSDEELAGLCAVDLIQSGYSRYLMKRLGVILFEDLGGNPYLCAQYVATLEMIREWKKELHDEVYLLLLGLVLSFARAPKTRIVDNYTIVMKERVKEGYEIPDVAVDKHTKRGKAMGRHWMHFIEEGSRLIGQILPDEYREAAEGVLRKKAKDKK